MRSALRAVAAFLAVGLGLVLGGPLGAQNEIRFSPGDYVAIPGFPIVLPIELQAADPVSGFSFGVEHDGRRLRLTEARIAGALLDLVGPDPAADPMGFFVIDQEPTEGDGFVVAAILGPQDAQAVVLPAGTHHLLDVEYQALGGASGATTLSFTDQLVAEPGSPAVDLVVDVRGGIPRRFAASSVEVSFSMAFRRGDTDQSGGRNISDPLVILFYLFRGGTLGTCPPSFNVDGSVREGASREREDIADIGITDAIVLLQFLFAGGQTPPAPFDQCGQSPLGLSADMACGSFAGC